ncbi:uncharacterized protein LOC127750710 [Frankliniella occidentalis]|uniref:Uncharacterized protein LOC127750710 n=1 Tax=Frankliniella occidentalis TaxID=133901 RepID=A0A9C6XS70_FRAOC|nr:uncharacterized protein LOC127750710 [Frankliniella occidentalis]
MVLLLGSGHVPLATELTMLLGTLGRVGRRIPVLAVLGVTDMDAESRYAEAIIKELILDRRWKIAVALQLFNAEDSPVPVYTSALSLRPGVRCFENWTPMALERLWTPGSTLRLQALEKPRRHDDLRGCVVNMAYVSSPPFVFVDDQVFGIDLDVARFFAYGSNASLNILHGSQAVPKLESGQADMVLGGLFPRPSTRGQYTYSDLYTYDAVGCYTLRTRRLPRWQYPFRVISLKAWASILGLMVVIVVALEHDNGRGPVANAMTVVGVLWEGNPAPRTNSGRTAFYVFMWTFFCLHFTPAYRAALSMANLNSLKEPGLTDLDDVKRVLMLSDDMMPLMAEYPKLNKLLPLVEICNSPINCSNEVMRDLHHTALIMSKWTYWFFDQIILKDGRGRPILQLYKDPMATFHVSVMTSPDSPIMLALNRITAIVMESGLVRKSVEYYRHRFNLLSGVAELQRKTSYRPRALGMRQILAALSILAAGLLVSLVIFLGEMQLGGRY